MKEGVQVAKGIHFLVALMKREYLKNKNMPKRAPRIATDSMITGTMVARPYFPVPLISLTIPQMRIAVRMMAVAGCKSHQSRFVSRKESTRVARKPTMRIPKKQIANGVDVSQVGSMTPCTMMVTAR